MKNKHLDKYSYQFTINRAALSNLVTRHKNCPHFNKRLYQNIHYVISKDDMSMQELGIYIKAVLNYKQNISNYEHQPQ